MKLIPRVTLLLVGTMFSSLLPGLLVALGADGSTPAPAGINAQYKQPDIQVTQWVERFEREGREIYDKRNEILDILQLAPGMTVADVGAGSGLFSLLMAKAVGNEGKVFAVDIVPGFLEHIRDKAADASLENVTTIRATDTSSGLPANSVDLVFICDTYHHFEYPDQTMKSIFQALRPGGQLVLVEFKRIEGESSDWTLNHVRAGQDVFTREIEEVGFQKTTEVDLLKDNYILKFRRK